MSARRTVVGVLAGNAQLPELLFESLAGAYPLEFIRSPDGASPCDAVVSMCGPDEPGFRAQVAAGKPAIAYAGSAAGLCCAGTAWHGAQPRLDGGLDDSLGRVAELGAPVSSATVAAEGADSGRFLDVIHRPDADRWLPLLRFCRDLTIRAGWKLPPLRANLMFDDPNLHWDSFCFVVYRRLTREAAESNYHVSFAMVPLDCWYVNGSAAAVIRGSGGRLSFLIHGNDHIHKELIQPRSNDAALALAAQSLRRMRRAEARVGFDIPRVMAAPHGACDDRAAGAMLRVGFEAACISWGSLQDYNEGRTWPDAFGFTLAEFLGGGLPVIPRFRINKGQQTKLATAALLGQPLIPVGHHNDLGREPDLLRVVASEINALGDARWQDMTAIARSNYWLRPLGGSAEVRTFSRRIQLELDAPVREITLTRAWIGAADASETARVFVGGKQIAVASGGRELVLAGLEGARQLEIHCDPPNAVSSDSVAAPRVGLWPIARRLLTEVRDRAQPFIPRRQGDQHA